MKGETKLCLIYCISNFPAESLHGYLSLLYKLYAIYTIQRCIQEDHTAWSHGLVCMHALYYIILLENSGVLQIYQHCNEQEYNSIQQTELAVTKYFHIAKQLYLHYFNLKPLLLQKPALGNMIKDINGGGHRATLPVRGPGKKNFFARFAGHCTPAFLGPQLHP